MSEDEAASPVGEACQANLTTPGVPDVTIPVKISCPATSVAGFATETTAGPLAGDGSVIVTAPELAVTVGLARVSTARTVSPECARCTEKLAVPLAPTATAW